MFKEIIHNKSSVSGLMGPRISGMRARELARVNARPRWRGASAPSLRITCGCNTKLLNNCMKGFLSLTATVTAGYIFQGTIKAELNPATSEPKSRSSKWIGIFFSSFLQLTSGITPRLIAREIKAVLVQVHVRSFSSIGQQPIDLANSAPR